MSGNTSGSTPEPECPIYSIFEEAKHRLGSFTTEERQCGDWIVKALGELSRLTKSEPDAFGAIQDIYWGTPLALLSEGLFAEACGFSATDSEEWEKHVGTKELQLECNSCENWIEAFSRANAEVLLESHLCTKCWRKDNADFMRSRAYWAYSKRLKEIRAMPYGEYLKTIEWKLRSREVKKAAEKRCQLCNDGDRILHAHHRTYDRLGCEKPKDLIVLCDECHAKFHNKLP